MTLRTRAADFRMKLDDAVTPLFQNPYGTITLELTSGEVSCLLAALAEFTAGQDGWQPIATLPSGEEWDIRDSELSEDVSLARSVGDGEPLFFLLQEKDAGGAFQHTMWRPAIEWPKPPPVS